MDTPFTIGEHEEKEVPLSGEDVVALQVGLAGKLDVLPTAKAGIYSLRAKSHVGFIVLPSGLHIAIEPKVQIQTLFALLATVYAPEKDREVFKDDPHHQEKTRALFEFVVSIFAKEAEELIARGLLRGYSRTVESGGTIRGRLLISESLRTRPGLYDRHVCAPRHFTPDVPENRILRWTAFALRHHTYKEPELGIDLLRIERALSAAKLDPEAGTSFDRIQYHRINEAYRPAHRLARILLEQFSFSGGAGREQFVAYLLDMNNLFERYVGAVLKQHPKVLGDVMVEEQRETFLDYGKCVLVRPDVTLLRSQGPVLVLDAKYKLEEGQGDLYQMLSYCHALNLPHGVLVHPKSVSAPAGSVAICGPGDIKITYLSLDLGGTPEDLKEQSAAFVKRVRQVIEQGERAAPALELTGAAYR